MTRLNYAVWSIILVLLLALSIAYLWQISIILLVPNRVSVLQQLSIYQWVAIGNILYMVVNRFVKRNIRFLETFSHELTHSIVAMLFLQNIHSLYAEEGSGRVITSANSISHVPIVLGPYCLPIFSYMLLLIRGIVADNNLWIFDIVIGISLSFHTFCFIKQTGNHQTDINQFKLWFSYLYIWTARLINLAIILVAFFPRYNVFTSLWRFITTSGINIRLLFELF